MAGDVSDDVTRLQDYEGTPTFTSVGGGAGAAVEDVTFFQGTQSASRKVTSSADPGAGWVTDLTAGLYVPPAARTISPMIYDSEEYVAGRVAMIKINVTDGQDLNSTGLRFRLERDSVNSIRSQILIDDGTAPNRYIGSYPPKRSWLIKPILMTAWLDPGFTNTIGPPHFIRNCSNTANSSASYDIMGCTASFTVGAAKAQNLILDSIDISDGLYLTGGTESPDAPATFQDFVDYDEGTIANRIGHAIAIEGIIFFTGTMAIGQTGLNNSPSEVPLPTYFNDSNAVVVWPLHSAWPGWNRALINLEDAATQITWNSCIHKAQGIGRRTVDFGVIADVDATNDRIDIGVPGHWENGDIVEYRADHTDHPPGIPDTIGLDTLPEGKSLPQLHYYFVAENAPGEYSFYSLEDASAFSKYDTWQAALDDDRGNTLMSLNVGIDSPEERHRFRFWNDERPDITVVAGVSPAGTFTINGGTYENYRYWNLAPEVTVNDAFVIGISQIRQFDAVFDSVKFVDPVLLPLDENYALIDNANPDKISNCVFNFPGANSNDGHALRITVPGTYTFTGNTFPGNWGATGSNTAMIVNDSGGLVTLNITGGGDTPTYKNVTNSPENVTVINNNVNVTITNLQVFTEVRVYLAEDFNSPINTTELAGIEDVASPTEFTFSASAGTVVDIVIHNIDYKLPPNNRIKNFTVPTTDSSFPVQQILDTNFENP